MSMIVCYFNCMVQSNPVAIFLNHDAQSAALRSELPEVIFEHRSKYLLKNNLKNGTTFLRTRSGGHHGDSKLSKKGTSLHQF